MSCIFIYLFIYMSVIYFASWPLSPFCHWPSASLWRWLWIQKRNQLSFSQTQKQQVLQPSLPIPQSHLKSQGILFSCLWFSRQWMLCLLSIWAPLGKLEIKSVELFSITSVYSCCFKSIQVTFKFCLCVNWLWRLHFIRL